MGRKKKYESEEPFVTRADLIAKRGLSLKYIKTNLRSVEYNLGHRTKKYKMSEVDAFLAQTKRAG